MLNFKYSTSIDAPLETVWEFHEREDILQILTPPWQPVRIIRREGGLGVGAISEFRIFLGLIPVTWIARHTQCDRYHYFTDEQIEGPLVSWTHRHQFDREGDRTRLTDAIAYELPGGIFTEFFLAGWVESRLRDMFRYRHEVTQQECHFNDQ
ncbi:MAG: SRPBCC family protein [Cyanobacteria bacterium P01_E01_bin.42]